MRLCVRKLSDLYIHVAIQNAKAWKKPQLCDSPLTMCWINKPGEHAQRYIVAHLRGSDRDVQAERIYIWKQSGFLKVTKCHQCPTVCLRDTPRHSTTLCNTPQHSATLRNHKLQGSHSCTAAFGTTDAQHVVAESVECRLHVWKVGSLKAERVKPMTYQIYTCRYLAWHSAITG